MIALVVWKNLALFHNFSLPLLPYIQNMHNSSITIIRGLC